VSDSLMFQRGEPMPSDPHLSHVYGLALPLLKRGMPVTPVQLENVTVPRCLNDFRVLLLSYDGQKPLSPDVHVPLAAWVKHGGALVVVDGDNDPYNRVREWWNSGGRNYATPREHLFEQLGLTGKNAVLEDQRVQVGKGSVLWLRENPAKLAAAPDGDGRLIENVQRAAAAAKPRWRETNHLLLRRGPHLIGAGLDESVAGEPQQLRGRFVNLFDPQLQVRTEITLAPATRFFLLDLDSVKGGAPRVLASACKILPAKQSDAGRFSLTVEGVDGTPAVILLHAPRPPRQVALAGQPLNDFNYSRTEKLLWIRFANESRPRDLHLAF
jgi:hypothetical protein